MNCKDRPYRSLSTGSWFKLIGGASFQDLPALHNLALVYTLAGADCVDVCADPAVIVRVAEAVRLARRLASAGESMPGAPLLMVSLNDGADPHFRKAQFPSFLCPSECHRPCLRICPVDAITGEGVIAERCYGCGRCAPVCPIGLITMRPWEQSVQSIGSMLAAHPVDALEIHTHSGNWAGFQRLWTGLTQILPRLKLVAISFPNEPGIREHIEQLCTLILASALGEEAKRHLVWQVDGLPMSGDLARGTARTAVQFAAQVQDWNLPGHLQLAGGTNDTSVALAASAGVHIAGVGYGSYARRLVRTEIDGGPLEKHPALLSQAVRRAQALVRQLKPDIKEGTTPWLKLPS